MPLLDLLRIVGLSLLVPAFLWLLWELWGDPSRGRSRCPHCWYDMSRAVSLLCPECGRDARREHRLFKTRRSRFRSAVAVFLLIASAGGAIAPTVASINWILAAPTRLLIYSWPIADRSSDPQLAVNIREELRTRTYTLSQFHALARACAAAWADGKQTEADAFASQVFASADVVFPDRISISDTRGLDVFATSPAEEQHLALKALGAAAADLVPDLAVALHDSSRGDQMEPAAVLAILAPGCPKALGVLIDRFADKHEQWVGTIIAHRVGPAALPRFEPLFKSPAEEVRRAALDATLEMDHDLPEVRAVLIHALDDAAPGLVFRLLRSITLPSIPQDLIPMLRPLLHASAAGVSTGEEGLRPADFLLTTIPIPRDAVADHLHTLLADSDPPVRTTSAALLLLAGPDPGASEILLASLSDHSTRIRDLACCCYAALNPVPTDALSLAAKLVTDPDTFTRLSASRLLRTRATPQAACEALAAALTDPRAHIREFAAEQLRIMRDKATPAVPALRSAEGDADATVRKAVARALRDITRQPGQPLTPDETVADKLDAAERTNSVASALAAFLHDPDPAIRAAAVKQLPRLESYRNNYYEISRALASTDPVTRDAVWAHLSAHVDPGQFLGLLMPLLHNPDTQVRLFAATHADEIAPSAKPAMISQLQQLLRTEQSPKVKGALQKSLGTLVPPLP